MDEYYFSSINKQIKKKIIFKKSPVFQKDEIKRSNNSFAMQNIAIFGTELASMANEKIKRVKTRMENENDKEKTDNQEANITIRQTQPVKRSVFGQRKSKQTSHLFPSARASDVHKRVLV